MWVAKQMEHTDCTMIARVYGRWMPQDHVVSGLKAVATFSNDSSQTEPQNRLTKQE